MSEIGFGKIVDLEIQRGEPFFITHTKVIRDIALDKSVDAILYNPDGILKPQVIRMLNQFSKIRDGTILYIRIQDGLPLRLQVKEKT